MKHAFYGALLLLVSRTSFTQENVGIGETLPGAKLTVKSSDVLEKSLLVKTSNDDTTFYIQGRNHFMNGYVPSVSTLTLNNRYSLPFDNPQLSIVASGERVGANYSGSLSRIDFSNINSSNRFIMDAYLGGMTENTFSFYYLRNNVGYPMMHFRESGRLGLGTFDPAGRLHINHRSNSANPTLLLFDSSNIVGPIIEFRNAGGSKTWQIRSELSHSTGGQDYLDIVLNNNILATFGNANNFGIGNSSPTERLDVTGNIRLSGEVVRPSTGAANLVPIAYGNIGSSAVINSGSGNFTASRLGIGWYAITITGETYQTLLYSAMITPIAAGFPVITTTGSDGSRLYVYTFASNGSAIDIGFSFVVYKQ
jgi:hypothetical protein